MWIEDGPADSTTSAPVSAQHHREQNLTNHSCVASTVASLPGSSLPSTPQVVPSPGRSNVISSPAVVRSNTHTNAQLTPGENRSFQHDESTTNSDDINVDQLSCPLCLELYDTPCILGCGHAICWSCLDSLRKAPPTPSLTPNDESPETKIKSPRRRGNSVAQVMCPTCGGSFLLPEHAGSIPVNHLIKRKIQEMTAVTPASNMASVVRTPKCERCEATLASVACDACDLLLCVECNAVHHKGPKLRHHELIDVRSYLSKSVDAPFCEIQGHGRYRKDLVCSDTGTAICMLCVQTSSPAKQNVLPLAEALENGVQKLGDAVVRTSTSLDDAKIGLATIEKVEGDLREGAREEVKRLRADFKRLRFEVDQQELKTVTAITEAKETQIRELRGLAAMLKASILEANIKLEKAKKACDLTPASRTPSPSSPSCSAAIVYSVTSETEELCHKLNTSLRVYQTKMGSEIEGTSETSKTPLLSRPVVMTMNTAATVSFIHNFARVDFEHLPEHHVFKRRRGHNVAPVATPEASPRNGTHPAPSTHTPSSSSSSYQKKELKLTPAQQARRRGNNGAAANAYRRSQTHTFEGHPRSTAGNGNGGGHAAASPRTLVEMGNPGKVERVVHASHRGNGVNGVNGAHVVERKPVKKVARLEGLQGARRRSLSPRVCWGFIGRGVEGGGVLVFSV